MTPRPPPKWVVREQSRQPKCVYWKTRSLIPPLLRKSLTFFFLAASIFLSALKHSFPHRIRPFQMPPYISFVFFMLRRAIATPLAFYPRSGDGNFSPFLPPRFPFKPHCGGFGGPDNPWLGSTLLGGVSWFFEHFSHFFLYRSRLDSAWFFPLVFFHLKKHWTYLPRRALPPPVFDSLPFSTIVLPAIPLGTPIYIPRDSTGFSPVCLFEGLVFRQVGFFPVFSMFQT